MPAGHDHVGQHQVDRARMAFPDLQGFRAGTGFQHLVAAILQDQVRHVAQHRFVLDHQDGFLPPGTAAAWAASAAAP